MRGHGGGARDPGNDSIVAVERIGKGGADRVDLVPAEHVRLERGRQAERMTRWAVPDDVPDDLQTVIGEGRRRNVGARRRRLGTLDCKMLPHALVAVRIHHNIVGNRHVLVGDGNCIPDYICAPATLREVLCAPCYIAVART